MKKDTITNNIDFNYYNIEFIIVNNFPIFDNWSKIICEEIKKLGFKSNIRNEIDDIPPTKDCLMCAIVIEPLVFTIPKNKNIFWIAIQTEQLYSKYDGSEIFGRNKLYKLKPYLKHYNVVIDFSDENIKQLESLNKKIKIHKCNLFNVISNYKKPSLKSNAKYDLLFIGAMPGIDERREKILNYLKKYYKVHPINDGVYDNDIKSKAIAESKILLNIHNEEARFFEQPRFCDYICEGGFVMSEYINNSSPFVDGEDYISFNLNNMCSLIDYYLENPKERFRIAKNAQEKLLRNNDVCDKLPGIIVNDAILENYKRYLKKTKRLDIKFFVMCNLKSFVLNCFPFILDIKRKHWK